MANIYYKNAASVKANPEQAGFTGYASTWTRTPDYAGDVVAKGAFTKTLADWSAKGCDIPLLWLHNDADPNAYIGWAKCVEDDHGLKVDAVIDTDNPMAKQVHKLLKNKQVAEMSFAFRVLDSATVEVENGVKANELRELDLLEVSVVPHGCNPDTSIDDVKAVSNTPLFTNEEVAKLKALINQAPSGEADSKSSEDAGRIKHDEALKRIANQVKEYLTLPD